MGELHEQMPGYDIILENKFDELKIHESIKQALKDMNMMNMTPIQASCIPHLLEDKDLMGAAKTGSGKTLAFLVPLVHKVLKSDFEPRHGTAAIVMSPTRELCVQIFEVLKRLVAHTNLRAGLIIGGKSKDVEARYLKEGVAILVCTPGRLLDHLKTTKYFYYHKLQTLIIDEADRLMEQGFLEEMKQIVRTLPKKRQTVLFSATLKMSAAKLKSKMKKIGADESSTAKKKVSNEEKVLTLACLSLRPSCVTVDLSKVDLATVGQAGGCSAIGQEDNATVSQLTQGYVMIKSRDRFRLLYTFLRRNRTKKVMVFMSTCLEVKYYYELLNLISIPVLALHGKQKQSKRLSNFDKFKDKEAAIILCTDVAARGLDIPLVDWVVQYDPPDDPKEYIHRVGRTARAGASGQAIIFLRPEERDFLFVLAKHKVSLTELEFEDAKILPIQESLEKIVESNNALRSSAQAAFTTVVRAYQTFKLKCFDVNKLDLQALAVSFGLKQPPQVMINVSLKSKKPQKRGVGYNSDNDDYFVPSKQHKLE